MYYRNWFAFSLSPRKFHSLNIFNSNFCESGRAWFAEKIMEFPSRVVSKTNSILFSARSAVYDERAEGTSSWHGLCSKIWNPPRMEVQTLRVSTWKKDVRRLSFGNIDWIERLPQATACCPRPQRDNESRSTPALSSLKLISETIWDTIQKPSRSPQKSRLEGLPSA